MPGDESTPEAVDASDEGPYTVVAIPEDRTQQVLDFIGRLHSGEADVSGHMLSVGLAAGMSSGGLMARAQYTMTGCFTTVNDDYNCTDSDKP
jgi:hypothetical protein